MGENVVIVGEKSPGSYAVEVLSRFRSGARSIVLRAYGRNISKAAYVAESVRRMTGGKASYGRITLHSEEVGEEAEERYVPVIEIEIKYEG